MAALTFFLKLLTAHTAADFLVQSREQAMEKRHAGPFACHLGIHLALLLRLEALVGLVIAGKRDLGGGRGGPGPLGGSAPAMRTSENDVSWASPA